MLKLDMDKKLIVGIILLVITFVSLLGGVYFWVKFVVQKEISTTINSVQINSLTKEIQNVLQIIDGRLSALENVKK